MDVLLRMSVYAAVMILAVTALRALTLRRLPKRIFPALWGLVALRLLIPVFPASPVSVYSLLPRPAAGTGNASGAVFPIVPAPAPIQTPPLPGGTALLPAAPDPVFAGVAPSPVFLVWLAAFLLCAGFFAVSYILCRRRFRESLPVENAFAADWLAARPLQRPIRLRQSDRIDTPLTYGLLRPVILLPKRTDWSDTQGLSYVLQHEFIHIRRLDALWKLVLTAAVCVHWFNPAVWLMYALANRDLELSCDEAVLRAVGPGHSADYARALLRMEERRSGLFPLSSHFGKNAIEGRVRAIMKKREVTACTVLLSCILVLCTLSAFSSSTPKITLPDAPAAAEPTPVPPKDPVVQKPVVPVSDAETDAAAPDPVPPAEVLPAPARKPEPKPAAAPPDKPAFDETDPEQWNVKLAQAAVRMGARGMEEAKAWVAEGKVTQADVTEQGRSPARTHVPGDGDRYLNIEDVPEAVQAEIRACQPHQWYVIQYGQWQYIYCESPVYKPSTNGTPILDIKDGDDTESGMWNINSLSLQDDYMLIPLVPRDNLILYCQSHVNSVSYQKITLGADGSRTVVTVPSVPTEFDDSQIRRMEKYLVDGDYPKNAKGETYGPNLGWELGYGPDLEGAQGEDENGNSIGGYMRMEDYSPPDGITSEERIAWIDAHVTPFWIPLYDQEGVQIGEFQIG